MDDDAAHGRCDAPFVPFVPFGAAPFRNRWLYTSSSLGESVSVCACCGCCGCCCCTFLPCLSEDIRKILLTSNPMAPTVSECVGEEERKRNGVDVSYVLLQTKLCSCRSSVPRKGEENARQDWRAEILGWRKGCSNRVSWFGTESGQRPRVPRARRAVKHSERQPEVEIENFVFTQQSGPWRRVVLWCVRVYMGSVSCVVGCPMWLSNVVVQCCCLGGVSIWMQRDTNTALAAEPRSNGGKR